MTRRFTMFIVALGVASGLVATPGVGAQSGRRAEHWVGTWATALVSSQQTFTLPASFRRAAPPQPQGGAQRAQLPQPIQSFNNQTLRQVVQTSYLSEAGNHAGQASFPVERTIPSWYFVARVEVVAPDSVGAVVTFGDSITDGTASTANANHRWPDDLARRLASAGGSAMGGPNLGTGGGRAVPGRVGGGWTGGGRVRSNP